MLPIPDIFLTALSLSLARHLHLASCMTTSVSSDLRTGSELGGQASSERGFGGLTFAGQTGSGWDSTTTWNGGAWSAHPLSAASDDPAAGSASTAPSFRSSWQSAVGTWSGTGNGSGDGEEEKVIAEGAADGTGASAPGLAGKTGKAALSATPAAARVQPGVARAQQTDSTQSAAAGVPSQTGKAPVTARAVQAAITRSAETTSDLSVLRESADKADHTASTVASGRSKKKTRHAVTGAPLPLAVMPMSIAVPISASRQTSALSLPGRKGQEAIESSQLSGAEAMLNGPKGVAESGISATPTAIAAAGQDTNGTPALFRHNTSRSQATQNQTAPEGVAISVDEPSIALSEVPLQGAPVARGALSGEDLSNPAAAVVRSRMLSSVASAAGPAGNAVTGAGVGVDRPMTQANTHTASGTVSDPARSEAEQSVLHAAPRDLTRVSGAPPVARFHAPSSDISLVAPLPTSAAVHVSAAPAVHHAQAVSSATTSAQDTFSALDAGSLPGNPIWTQAGSRHAEAGFRDPDLGWVGVRADLSASGVHATLVPSSADAAQALSGHIAGLDAHLTEQHAQIASLSMASPGDGGIGSGAGQQMQQNADRNTQGNPQENLQTRSEGVIHRPSSASRFSPAPQSESPDASSQGGAMRGTRISVMA